MLLLAYAFCVCISMYRSVLCCFSNFVLMQWKQLSNQLFKVQDLEPLAFSFINVISSYTV